MNEFNQRSYGKDNKNVVYDSSKGNSFAIAKVFGFMFLGLLITAVVMFALGGVIANAFKNNLNAARTSGVVIGITITACIVQIILTFVIQKIFFQSQKSILIPAIIYCVTLGVMLSTFTVFIDWRILGMAFAMTCLAFGLMSLIGLLSKDKLNSLALLAFGILGGVAMISLVSLIFMFFNPGVFTTMHWIVQFGLFAFIMLITAYDVRRIKDMAENDVGNNNINLYCAFNLFVDFIGIFLKILYFLIMISSRR